MNDKARLAQTLSKVEYLGDAVYVSIEAGMIRLQADSNVIYLEPQVYDALVAYVKRIEQIVKEVVGKEGL